MDWIALAGTGFVVLIVLALILSFLPRDESS